MSGQTFLFADLAGFTALTEAHGDDEAVELVDEFFRSVRELLPQHRAAEIKSIGDAAMLRGSDAEQAVRLGLAIVDQVGTRHEFPSIRVGMNTGPAVERGGDWFGACVNVAARVSGLASGGEVLLTAATREAAGEPSGIDFHPRGSQRLKNVSEAVTVYAARPSGAHDFEGLPIDPVCRMGVEPERAAGTLSYANQTFYFCSLSCAAKFAREPEAFA